MRLAPLRRSRPAFDDVPVEHIAELIEATTTARTAVTAAYRSDFGRRLTSHQSGTVDFVDQLHSARRTDGVEHLQVGRDIFHRLSEKEARNTGKTWRWEGHACPYQEGERAETAASLRLRLAEPTVAAIATIDGERLHHFAFRVESGPGHEDATAARMYDHMRHHRMTRVLLDVWLTDDGRLRRTRERARMRDQVGAHTLRAVTTENWDFGVATGIVVPSSEQILR